MAEESTLPKPDPKRIEIDRMTVVERVYHQQFGEQPTAVTSQYERVLTVKEQPYSRQLKISEEWQPLSTGWIKPENAGMITIKNEEGKFLVTIPTPEQLAECAKRIIQIKHVGAEGGWEIPPGESMRGQSYDAANLLIRCAHGEAKVTVNVFPR